MKTAHQFQKLGGFLCVIGLVLLTANEGLCQTFTITGTAPSMTVSSGTVNGLSTATNSNCTLTYQEISANTESITVASGTTPQWTLKVKTTNATRGTAQPEVTLSTTAQNFITGIPRGTATGTCKLYYTLAPTYAQGTGTGIFYRVTYTLQSP
jgi:hypothetical protein